MTERGVVTETRGNTAVVSVEKREQCKACGMCLFKDNGKAQFYADNTVGAKVGDTVVIENRESGKLLGAILVFLIPLVILGAAVLAVRLFAIDDLFIPIIGIGAIAVYYAFLALMDKKFRKIKAFTSTVAEIVNSATETRDDGTNERE